MNLHKLILVLFTVSFTVFPQGGVAGGGVDSVNPFYQYLGSIGGVSLCPNYHINNCRMILKK